MKHILAVMLLVCTVGTQALAQMSMSPNTVPQYFYQTLQTNKVYGNDTVSLSGWYKLGGASHISYNIVTNDSVSVKVAVDYRYVGTTAVTAIDSTTLVGTSNTGSRKEYVVRDAVTDKCPGLKIEMRFRTVFASSANGVNNGVTLPTFSNEIDWKP